MPKKIKKDPWRFVVCGLWFFCDNNTYPSPRSRPPASTLTSTSTWTRVWQYVYRGKRFKIYEEKKVELWKKVDCILIKFNVLKVTFWTPGQNHNIGCLSAVPFIKLLLLGYLLESFKHVCNYLMDYNLKWDFKINADFLPFCKNFVSVSEKQQISKSLCQSLFSVPNTPENPWGHEV